MALQSELLEKATAALLFSAALREALMSKGTFNPTGVLSNESLGS